MEGQGARGNLSQVGTMHAVQLCSCSTLQQRDAMHGMYCTTYLAMLQAFAHGRSTMGIAGMPPALSLQP